MLDLWDCFVPLLKRAAETVRQRLPSMAKTLDSTFTSLAQDLENTTSKATSGPFLDPTQDAGQMLTQLKAVSRHMYAVSARLQELSRTSRSLRGGSRREGYAEGGRVCGGRILCEQRSSSGG